MSWPGWTLFPRGGGTCPRGIRGVPTACSIPQSEQTATVRLWTGVSVAKLQNKSDKIKAVFIWEAEIELPAGNWALSLCHFCYSLGQCREACVGCEPRHYYHPHTVKHLHFTQRSPSSPFPLSNLGRWVKGHSCWMFI